MNLTLYQEYLLDHTTLKNQLLVVLKFEKCEYRDDASFVDGYQESVKC